MKDLKKYYTVSAPPEDVYLALTTASTIHLWWGEPAVMTEEAGSEFSLWDGSIEGRNLEFVKNEKIVQQWYFGDQSEESVVTLLLHPHKKGTSVELRQTNIPDEDYEDILEGWDEAYFAAIIEFYRE